MMQAARSFVPSESELKVLGREVWKKLPMLAQKILKPYLTAVPYDTNFNKIERYYLPAFASLIGINPEYIQGPIFKSTKVDIRKLFMAAMIHIYCPHVYYQHPSEINLSKKGFVMCLSGALKIPESNTSGAIREVVAWEKDYDDFRAKVHLLVEKLKDIA